ncbi:MAG: hypothetical protein F4Y47_20050 [Acidobacteriia bacterium]|nr:hypothetical protein [Terriglobia bacterium]MYG02560.1 hypothetical protein [Terriglobia bacterium]MYK08029.1 hypothetical protein [Terriglobia bacterium]
MPRYKERRLQLEDLVPSFEKEPTGTHLRNARGAIERLREDGRAFWPKGSSELDRWERGCNELWQFLNRLGERRHVKRQELHTAFREFIQEFEHSTGRMFQMLFSRPGAFENDPDVEQIVRWRDLVYRLSTYAIVSFWTDDKTEESITDIKLTLNPNTGAMTVEEKHRKTKTMQVPRAYRRSTKKI